MRPIVVWSASAKDVRTPFGKNRIGPGEADERDTRDAVFRIGCTRREDTRRVCCGNRSATSGVVDGRGCGSAVRLRTARGASAAIRCPSLRGFTDAVRQRRRRPLR